MITRTSAFVTSDKLTFAELDAAIGHELGLLFHDNATTDSATVAIILKNRDKIVDLLTTTATSKPKARKINGATRKLRAPRPNTATLPVGT